MPDGHIGFTRYAALISQLPAVLRTLPTTVANVPVEVELDAAGIETPWKKLANTRARSLPLYASNPRPPNALSTLSNPSMGASLRAALAQ